MLLLLPQTFASHPNPTLPPTGVVELATAQGRGMQIYRCAAKDSGYQWTFDRPEATLYQPSTNTRVGSHGAGPSWTWIDGSSITGTVFAKAPATNAGAIPWLLLQTHSAVSTLGVLSTVLWVRRSETSGGNAPVSGCDAQHVGTSVRVPYAATYTFYAAGSGGPF